MHFPDPYATPFVQSLVGRIWVNGLPARVGDEIAVLDPQGVVAGHFVVQKPGQFGMLQVYGDDPTTPVDEGAQPGDVLEVRVWDSYAQAERWGTLAIRLTPGAAIGAFQPATLPLTWADQSAVAVDIYAQAAAVDGELMMRYLFGFRGNDLVANVPIPAGAARTTAAGIVGYLQSSAGMLDVDGNGREDALSDGILILRHLLGMRGPGWEVDALPPDAQITNPNTLNMRIWTIR